MKPHPPQSRPKPVVLAILDGFGCGAHGADDAVHLASTPCLDSLMSNYPHMTINASELHVGLPCGQMGNSEVGHMNIGAGRVVMQDLPKIDAAVADGTLAENPKLIAFIEKIRATTGTVHLMGLLSPGGVHSHQNHVATLAGILADAGLHVWVHAFLDGRDTPPKSALDYMGKFYAACFGIIVHLMGEKKNKMSRLKTLFLVLPILPMVIKRIRRIHIATISGRYYAMDRDKRWERVEKAYYNMMGGVGTRYPDVAEAIQAGYTADKSDEFIEPCVIGKYDCMREGDGLLMANFRADRAREILSALLDPSFDGFARGRNVRFGATLGMVEYSSALAPYMPALFPPETLHGILGEIISDAGLKQLRIAETEKYAHVTFFFNGGREEVYEGEERILIPSPNVATYDLQPEMSAYEMTDALVDAIENDRFDFIVVNYANTDMVGHTGNIQAATAAVEAVDACLKRLSDAVLAKNGAMLITADHGNAEQMFDAQTKQAHTAHTLNLVPAILIEASLKGKTLNTPPGRLADIAPTILEFLRMKKPDVMTGHSLLNGLYE